MIDIENEVIDFVSERTRDEFPGVFVTSTAQAVPPQLPCVSVAESESIAYTPTQTAVCTENHAAVTYEVNVYSNKPNGAKQEAKKIAGFVDTLMCGKQGDGLGFRRMSKAEIPNLSDLSVFRMTLRYFGIVGKHGDIHA